MDTVPDRPELRDTIKVDVETSFLPDQSDTEEGRFVFAYTITISNTGAMPVQLLTRRWIITDASGRVQEVEGDGVVGKQPRLRPGSFYRYSSLSVIETPVGTMEGSYGMVDADGIPFRAPIAAFRLAVPGILN
ncbi:MAG: Co2+/Mg2+ efflux protein ApaG [Gammaproteobacteria bacterium]|nr:Co2+/Mg2+ efflux protein ApaG [Gammaproteobacteria bacterium]